jgi:hypothetical protein
MSSARHEVLPHTVKVYGRLVALLVHSLIYAAHHNFISRYVLLAGTLPRVRYVRAHMSLVRFGMSRPQLRPNRYAGGTTLRQTYTSGKLAHTDGHSTYAPIII